MRFFAILAVAILASCSSTTVAPQPNGIWHQSDELAEFVDQWTVCGAFYAATTDKRWLLRVDITTKSGIHSESELVSLLDFSNVRDRDYGISLFRNNDIAIDDSEPVVIPATGGDGTVHVSNKTPDWESTVGISLENLTFPFDHGEIRIDKVFFENFPKSNWCPG